MAGTPWLYEIHIRREGWRLRERIEISMVGSNAHLEAALAVIGRLRSAGHEAYLAGGCVRDLLLGHEPSDYDVATSATPDVVLEMFERTSAVGAHFGVVLVATGGGADLAGAIEEDQEKAEYVVTEVATFRSDGAYSDGRHPDAVKYTTSAEEDVRRRDFTINGLLLDAPPNANDLGDAAQLRGTVVDFVGGRADQDADRRPRAQSLRTVR
jgi:poly(A) polymerase